MSTGATDPLASIRQDLVAAATRGNRRRGRRRRTLLATALALLALAAAAGASALGDLSTGVPVVDNLLATGSAGRGPIDHRPGTGGASEPLALPNARDGRDATEVAYVNQDGQICKAQADLRKSDSAPRGSDGGGCFEPRDLADQLRKRTVMPSGLIAGPDHRIYDGWAEGDVVAIRFRLEDGRSFPAELTPAWRPEVPGAEPLRLYVAIDQQRIDVGGDGVQFGELDAAIGQRYTIEARLADGQTVEIQGQ